MTFTEKDGRTTLTVLVQHGSKEARDAHIGSGMEAGMREALDLLERVAVSLHRAGGKARLMVRSGARSDW